MLKLVNAYTADPTLKNAQKVVKADSKNPMASCMLPIDALPMFRAAMAHK